MTSIAIRGSSLDGWADCPRRQAASTYAGLLAQHGYTVSETQRWVTPTIGTAIHSGSDMLNQDYMKTGQLPTEDLILAAIEHGVDKFQNIMIKDLEKYDVKYTVKFPDIQAIRKHIDEYVRIYANQILPQRKLELSEQHFKFDLNENFHLKSTCDSYGFGTLYDLKTGAKTVAAHYQIGVYTFLLKNSGYNVTEAQLDYIQRERDADPAKHVVIKYDAAQCEIMSKYMIGRIMSDLTDFLKTGDLNVFTANPRSESCNKIMCPLWADHYATGGSMINSDYKTIEQIKYYEKVHIWHRIMIQKHIKQLVRQSTNRNLEESTTARPSNYWNIAYD